MITRNYQKNVRTANASETPAKNDKEVSYVLWNTSVLRKYKSDKDLVKFFLPK